ncbi:hypothetical protein IW261DRAFT_1417223 [Armillaria novae-zelandiae]|uniref:Uncharacterized protein n=1 Tax=Armillaria novae-zelandiae TaxID=153914 RepID=A0AA39PFH2_9AGAR|nr:hypothetical protein IW261DRAFT_1417223 [Armillaria novae-zelandiae]
MSIDPPRKTITRRLSRDVTMQSVVLPPLHNVAARDMSMEPAPGSFLRSSGSQIRDTSLPLGFRVRASVTPQPVRDTSEPPTISSLGSKPVFVRGPVPEASKPQTTLGSLVDTQRRTQSPVRQHSSSSLLFGSQSTSVKGSRPPTTAERTLHELDVYRTPLKPSRLRENSALASSPGDATDMFSRKKSYQRMPGGRTVKAKVANQTKPYAGDAGIKKHLARSRRANVEVVPSKGGLNDVDVSMNEGRPLSDILPEVNKDHGEFKLPDNQPKTSKAVEKQSTMPSSSSLRVGRTFTSRNHIDRPSRPGRNGFSAVYDDGEDEEREEETRKEMKIMEEAAKHVPVFNIPAGFSFAKDADKPQNVVTPDLSKAKEPPIPSLPFSISSFQSGTSSVSSTTSIPPSNGSGQASATASPFTPSTSAPDMHAKVDAVPASSTAETLPKTKGGIPDFFASSKTVAQTPLVVPPITLTATGAPAATSLPFSLTPPPAATQAPSAPVHDADNPLWNGIRKDDNAGNAHNEPPVPAAVNGGGGIFAFGGSGMTTSFPLFGSVKQDGPQTSIPAENTSKPSSFSFDSSPAPGSSSVADSTPPPPLFSIAPAKTAEPDQAQKPLTLAFGSNAAKEGTSSSAFSFGQTPNNSAEPKTNGFFAKQIEAVDSAPKPSTTTAFTFAGNPAPAAPSTPAISFGGALSNKETTTAQSPFSLSSAPAPVPGAGGNNPAFAFGPPSAPSDKTVSAPKPPFSFGPAPTAAKDSGAANPVSFAFGSGPSDKKNESSPSSMFGFGATPSTPPISDADKKPSFGFTPTSTSAPATSFSFGGGSTSDVPKPFSFGSAAMNPRPVTPPNQDQEIKMDESPTRDMQITNGPKIAEPRPTLGLFPSFNNTSGGSSFGQSGGSMTQSFAFGAAPTASNPFAKENKPEENKGFGGFGQSSGTSSSFPFTRKTSEDPPRPSTAGAFSFQSPNSATGSGSGSGFGFGAASSGTTSTFPSGPLSAPNSPSTFNNPSPSFSFAAAPATTNPFGFGSQPASPATGSTNLPSVASTGFGGGFGGSSNPFGAASTTPAAPSSGGTLFTIGAAPSAPPNGMRQIKKLPNRRGAKR